MYILSENKKTDVTSALFIHLYIYVRNRFVEYRIN